MSKLSDSKQFVEKNVGSFGVVGPGLIGGSIAKDLRTNFPEHPIYAIGDPTQDTDDAVNSGVINELVSVREIPRDVNLIIISTPLRVIARAAEEIARQRYDGSGKRYVMDVGSTKQDVSSAFSELTDGSVEFIPTHPMSGTEFTGFRHSRKGLFLNQAWVICPHQNNTERGVLMARELVTSIGARAMVMDAESHDRRASLVSHTIITLSNLLFDFVRRRDPEALDMAGSGFVSTTRHASGNPDLYESILRDNGPAVQENIDAFAEYLRERRVTELDYDFFKGNKDERDQLVHKRGGTTSSQG